ncbi:hypothetical protein BGX28_005117 [Mortierella sp. GBA30]|nr:hypothetical protein BGX28_005117 [Mortierella sp. GBA30]
MNHQDDILLDNIHSDLRGCNSLPDVDSNEARTKRILVTGGAGFIGSVLVRKIVLNYPQYFVLVIDKLDYCSSLKNMHPFLPIQRETSNEFPGTRSVRNDNQYPNFKFVQGDITDLDFVQSAMQDHQIDTIIHLAAQTHVDKSFGESIEFSKSNVLGTHVMLEAARRSFCSPISLSTKQMRSASGFTAEAIRDKSVGLCRFIYVSTDEVYGEVPFGQPDCKEDAPMAPSNPYSATKAAAECMVQAYHKSFHLPVIITRSNNVYGPFQYPEKIFPKFIMSLFNEGLQGSGTQGPCLDGIISNSDNKRRDRRHSHGGGGHCYIHGSGQHSRTYLYVADVANALDVILHRGEVGQVYNIGAGHEMNNLVLAQDLIHRMVVPALETGSKSEMARTTTDAGSAPLSAYARRIVQSSIHAAEQHLSVCCACAERIQFVEDRAFNDRRYAVDSSKLLALGWKPLVGYEEGIGKTSKFR